MENIKGNSMEMAMIEIGVSDVKCIGFNSLMELPLGRYGIYDPKTERVIDEAKIEELRKIIGTWTTPVDNAVPVRILNSWITAAGLGRKDEA
jgi:hypothetical protein